MERLHDGNDTSAKLSNYRSVLGFRGEEKLDGGLKAIWQIEGALSLDNGGGGSFSSRDTRIGLAGGWGTAFAGVWTLPYTAATSGFDPFYPTTAGYMALMGNGSASISNHTQNTSAFDRRQVDQLQYWSSVVAGFSARAAYAFNEGVAATTGAKPWLASGSVSYELGDLLVTVAAERHNEYQARGTKDVAAKIGVAYRFGDVRVAAAAERLRYETLTGKLTRNAWYASATYRIGRGAWKASYSKAYDGKGSSDEVMGAIRSGSDTGASHYTVGFDYELSKRTTLQAFASRIDNQARADYAFAINSDGAAPGVAPHVVSLGIRHSF